LRQLRGELIALKEVRYVEVGQVEVLETARSSSKSRNCRAAA
jgi:hypothetical protein